MRRIKKYTNRRLYDTHESRYITLDELADLIREGEEVRVVDAKSGEDLTQATLAQIVVESRGAARMLPVPLLTQMIRMGDDALAEFMSHYLSWSLQMYFQARQGFQGFPGFQGLQGMNPYQFFGMPGGQALGEFFGGRFPWRRGKTSEAVEPEVEEPDVEEPEVEEPEGGEDLAALREEIARLSRRIDEMS